MERTNRHTKMVTLGITVCGVRPDPKRDGRVRVHDQGSRTDRAPWSHKHGETPRVSDMRNGTRSKTVPTGIRPVQIDVPRDRKESFEPVNVPKPKPRLDETDQIKPSLSPRA